MQAGRMKYRLELLEPVTVINSFGIVLDSAGKYQYTQTNETWRVKQLGGYEYTVTNIIPNIDRGMKTLICERVNP